MDIADSRSKLIKLVDDITKSYSTILEEKYENKDKENKDFLFLNNQNKLQKEELVERDNEIKSLNKKCYDYEQMINSYQEKMKEIEEEQICNNKVSLVKSQANALDEKDTHIEQLEQKIKLLQTADQYIKKNVTVKIEEVKSPIIGVKSPMIGVKSPIIGFSPTTSVNKAEKQVEPLNLESSDEDIQLKSVKHKNNKYYIIVGEEPQFIYKIEDDDEIGEKLGKRTPKKKGKGYDYEFFE